MTRTISFPLQQIALTGLVLACAALLSGCNTVEGVGQDVGAGGRAIERAAD